MGGVAFGTLAFAAGVASGDAGNTLKYTTTGVFLGNTFGGNLGENAGQWLTEQREAFDKGYNGSEAYNNKKFDERFLATEEFRDMINNKDILPEMSGGLVSEVKRARAIAREAHNYHTYGITDSNQIKACMKAGLTLEEGMYAIQLGESMKKSELKNPQQEKAFKARYQAAFKAQNKTDLHQQKIDDIWEAATKIRFM